MQDVSIKQERVTTNKTAAAPAHGHAADATAEEVGNYCHSRCGKPFL
jgi:hypothetical protein